MLLTTFRRWYRKQDLLKYSKKVISNNDFHQVLNNFIKWSYLVPEFIDEETLYQFRFKPHFINVEVLANAIGIMHYNVIRNNGQEYPSTTQELLIDDWLVNSKAYRSTLVDFLEKVRTLLEEINSSLENNNSSMINYHISNSMDILVTLQDIVEICHHRKL